MKIFHTSDWHLGKTLLGQSLLDDQKHVLSCFLEAVENEKPDAVIIAGDIYDRSIPSIDAVKLFDEVLHRIVIELKIPVLAIAGNHDSPSRLGFGDRLMRSAGYYVTGDFGRIFEPVVLSDNSGEVHFYLLPYAEPSVIREFLGDDGIHSFDNAYEKLIERISQTADQFARKVVVTHAFVTPEGQAEDNTSESERPLIIGGAEFVSAKHFSMFNYVALGHLHRAKRVASERIQYAGSLLKYSISEEEHTKGFNAVEMDAVGNVTVERRLLKAVRDLRTVEGYMNEIIAGERSDDYVFIKLLDKNPVTDAMERVRSVYPNALKVQNEALFRESELEDVAGSSEDRNPLVVFADFYKRIVDKELSEEARKVIEDILASIDSEEGYSCEAD